MDDLALPLSFKPVYQTIVWGGRRMAAWRHDLPEGPIGESWDLSDHQRGMSVVATGALAGSTLRDLTTRFGKKLVGGSYVDGDFPLMVKLIDANDRLSVQVHPDDALARSLGVGARGKTECWMMIEDGGELYVGTRPGCARADFERALADGTLADRLNRFQAKDGDFYFLSARTVHALGKGCLLYEVQQTCDVTFRVDDWSRVGLDGKPRPLHVAESLATIDFAAKGTGPVHAPEAAHPAGGSVRRLAQCEHFIVEERRAQHTGGGGDGICSIVICLGGSGMLSTAAGEV
ncbi:MAG: class I mannose-6-phosphate isomerase, partial [Planctomycetes bacterium]|nr:class I mannose-6-phosphate isomerase [Planctomycetota bacterium]